MTQTLEQRKQIVRTYIEAVLNGGQTELISDLFAPHLHEQVTRIAANIRRTFPDMKETIHELIAEGNTVMARWTLTGTAAEPILDIPAQGQILKVNGFSVYHFDEKGQITEDHALLDWLGALLQLEARILPPEDLT